MVEKILKDIADFIGIEEENRKIPRSRKPKNTFLLEGDVWEERERRQYNKDRFKPVRPLELFDWRQGK